MLGTALAAREKIVVGLTSEGMLGKKNNREMIQSFEMRAKRVVEFVSMVRPGVQVEIKELQDPYGPARYDPSLQAIMLSE